MFANFFQVDLQSPHSTMGRRTFAIEIVPSIACDREVLQCVRVGGNGNAISVTVHFYTSTFRVVEQLATTLIDFVRKSAVEGFA